MKILVIGGLGYIGRRVCEILNSQQHEVTILDANWYDINTATTTTRQLSIQHLDNFADISPTYLQTFEAVLLFAGHSSVAMSQHDVTGAFKNNVLAPTELVKKLHPSQLFLYSSSSTIYGTTGETPATETDTPVSSQSAYDLTKRTFDEYMEHQTTHPLWWGLRYPTVCGGSPHFRTDLMINMMYHTGKTQKKIYVFGGEVRRSILFIRELGESIITILSAKQASGIYNLTTLASTNYKIASEVSTFLNVPIEYDQPIETKNLLPTQYNYTVDSEKFHTTFNTTPSTYTILDILTDIDQYYPTAHLSARIPSVEKHTLK